MNGVDEFVIGEIHFFGGDKFQARNIWRFPLDADARTGGAVPAARSLPISSIHGISDFLL
jgi:hypothetical protein